MASFNNEAEYLIHLLSAVLKGEQADELPPNLSFQVLFNLAVHHSVANMAYYGIERLQRRPESPLAEKWAEIRDKEIMKDIIQTTELDSVSAALGAAGIRFIILKGSHLKTLYPQSDFRSMADIDIYIDENDAEGVKKALVSMGYEVNSLEHGVHDVYYKKPVMNIEVHRALFGESGREFEPLFGDLWAKSESLGGTCYNLKPEYFFAYLIAHGIKHYDIGGSGIRSFMDIYVYLRAAGGNFDTEKIAALFGTIGKREAFEDFIRLSEIWFGEGEYTEKYRDMAEFIIRGGTYGTLENQVVSGLKGKSKGSFLFSKLFPRLSYMREQYPVLRKAPVLLPLCWVVRWVKAATVDRKATKAKMRALKKN